VKAEPCHTCPLLRSGRTIDDRAERGAANDTYALPGIRAAAPIAEKERRVCETQWREGGGRSAYKNGAAPARRVRIDGRDKT
jgi:hypothetical protein